MQTKNAQCKGIIEFLHEVSVEASEVSGVQGLDPKKNLQPFI